MKQSDIGAAVSTYLQTGDMEPFQDVLEAVKAGRVIVENKRGSTNFCLIDLPYRHAFGARLEALRQKSGIQQRQLADDLDMSLSWVIRHMAGDTLGHWLMVAALIRHLGGDPEDYFDDYKLAKAERIGPPEAPRGR